MHRPEEEGELINLELGSPKQPGFSFISLHYTCMGSKERTERSLWPKMRVRGQIEEVPLLQEEQNPQSCSREQLGADVFREDGDC